MPTFPPGWKTDADGKRVSYSLKTRDFLEAIELFGEIADVAEELEHHPDLHLEEWNKVRIVSWSHDAGGLTKRDEALAAKLDALLKARAR